MSDNESTTMMIRGIPEEDRNKFKGACTIAGESMSSVLLEFMREYFRNTVATTGVE